MKKHIIFSLLLGATVACTTPLLAQNAESYESLMKNGNAKFDAKDYISAKTYYEMALKQKANDPIAKQKLQAGNQGRTSDMHHCRTESTDYRGCEMHIGSRQHI